MTKFTVFGYYPDNNQPWASMAEAETWQDAIHACTKDVAEGWKVRVCAVIEGDHICVDDLQETMEIENPIEPEPYHRLGASWSPGERAYYREHPNERDRP